MSCSGDLARGKMRDNHSTTFDWSPLSKSSFTMTMYDDDVLWHLFCLCLIHGSLVRSLTCFTAWVHNRPDRVVTSRVPRSCRLSCRHSKSFCHCVENRFTPTSSGCRTVWRWGSAVCRSVRLHVIVVVPVKSRQLLRSFSHKIEVVDSKYTRYLEPHFNYLLMWMSLRLCKFVPFGYLWTLRTYYTPHYTFQ